MHYRVLLLAAWLLFFSNLERVSNLLSPQRLDLLTPYAYVFVALIAVFTLALPSLQRLPMLLLMAVGVLAFLVSKRWIGYDLWGAALTVTLTEVGALVVTGLLTRQVIGAIWEFERSIVNFTVKHIGRDTKAFAVEQGEMYLEVRRARAFNRPLALLAVEPRVSSSKAAIERMVEEVQRATMKQYVLAALAKTLKDLFGPYSIIAQDNDKFLILLPEVSKENVAQLVGQVRERIDETMHLDLRIGTATLPEVEMFEELIEAAYNDMDSRTGPRSEEAAKPAVASVPGRATFR
jgi:hypothetical protein